MPKGLRYLLLVVILGGGGLYFIWETEPKEITFAVLSDTHFALEGEDKGLKMLASKEKITILFSHHSLVPFYPELSLAPEYSIYRGFSSPTPTAKPLEPPPQRRFAA